ncbi:MAG: hypothetical protein CM15mP122_4380 [Bacteroidota bacterium]|nr:MAG: hypothetical protein CM15mP122_4380 [Bacteroidota bacterium]
MMKEEVLVHKEEKCQVPRSAARSCKSSRVPVQAVGGLTLEQAIKCPQYGAPLVVLGAPLVIDADSFKTADGNLESSLKKYVMLFILKKYYTIKIRCCFQKIPAVVNYSSIKGSVELREIKLPEIGDHDVLLK